jgi:hypothetical protein
MFVYSYVIISIMMTTCQCFLQQSPVRTINTASMQIYAQTQVQIQAQEQTQEQAQGQQKEEENGISISTDPEYPYLFTGRLWFSPSLVKVPSDEMKSTLPPNESVGILSLFGYTLGGTVTLEYDTSPVGPYKEYVTMSSLVMKRGTIGQWGSRLYVSTQVAEDVCKDVWGVPAEVANIEFHESTLRSSMSDNDSVSDADTHSDTDQCLMVTAPPNPYAPTNDVQNINVEGWQNTRVLKPNEYKNINANDNGAKRWGNIPVLWTPTIKALWSPWVAGGVFAPPSSDEIESKEELPLHKLRLSASALRLSWSGLRRKLDDEVDDATKEELGIPLGIGLIVDNVMIEIGTQYGKL